MKKILCFAMSALMLVQIIALCAIVLAAPASSISISSGEGNEGATVALTVSIANNTGFGGLSLDVQFDKNVLEFVSAECKVDSGISQFTPAEVANANATLHLEYAGIVNVSGDIDLFTVSFRIKEGAALGDSAVTLVFDDASYYIGSDGVTINNFTATVTGGKVTVTDGLLGDVNNDKTIDAQDLTILARHIAKIEYITLPVALTNADIDKDGAISAADLTKLARHVAKIESIVQ